jgi:hypothetical protein
MATRKQTQAAKRNISKAQRAARSKRTIAKLPKSTRTALGQQAARPLPRRAGRRLARGPQSDAALRTGQETEHPRALAHGQVGPDPSDPTRELTPAELAAAAVADGRLRDGYPLTMQVSVRFSPGISWMSLSI